MNEEITRENEAAAEKSAGKKRGISPVVRFRIAVCLAAGACAFALKMYGGEGYEAVRGAYLKYTRDSIVIQQQDDNSELMRAVTK